MTDEPKKKRRGRKLIVLITLLVAVAGYRSRKLSENETSFPRA